MKEDQSRLSRPIQPMPDQIREALQKNGLLAAYQERPAYQRNDYLRWIASAKGPGTREKRVQQMLDELKKGGVYMKMTHAPSRKR